MPLDDREILDLLSDIYYFRLKDISGCEKFLSKIRGFIKLQKNLCGTFFQFSMLNISSLKELIQWNITGTLPGKLKGKISWALSYKILPPEITKVWEIAIFGGTLRARETNVEFNGFLWFFEFLKLSALILWLKTVLTLS